MKVTKVAGKKIVKNNGSNNITIDSNLKSIPNDDMEISIGYGATLNIGNYETLRTDIRISQRCDSKDKEKVFKELKEDVISKIKKECVELKHAGGL